MRTQIVQAHLVGDPGLARDIVEYNLATRAIGHYHVGFGSIGLTGSTIAHDSETLPFGDHLDAARAALDTSWWIGHETDRERFNAFRALPADARSALVAYAVIMSISVPHASRKHAPDISEEVVAHLAIDWPAVWRPDAAYWNRLSKDGIARQVLPVLGEEWVKANIGDKKAVLVQKLEDIFAGRAKSVTAEQTAAALAWQVPGMDPVPQHVDEAASADPDTAKDSESAEDDDLPDHLA